MGGNLFSFKQITEVAWYFPLAGWHGMSPVEMYGALDTASVNGAKRFQPSRK